jgi:hypothetical protein
LAVPGSSLPEKTTSASAELVARAVGTIGAPREFVAQAVAWLVHEDGTVIGEFVHAGNGHVSRIFVAETVNPERPGEVVARGRYLAEAGVAQAIDAAAAFRCRSRP